MNLTEFKRSQLEHLAQHREGLRVSPRLKWLFFEITNQCNLHCKHCGSNCSSQGQLLTIDQIKNTLSSLKSEKPMICLTGGEPMLHPNFFEIADCVSSMGFSWGMTTNGTLIDKEAVLKLKQAGMSTISVSLDGMEESHDSLRQQKGAWRRAIRGLTALQEVGYMPQVTTVLHQENFDELETLYSFLNEKIKITNWRPINVEPIGRACESDSLMLKPKQFADLISFILKKRFDANCNMNITFGCSHYLGVEYERMVRDHYFLCGAGIYNASIRSNGDICACLDIENIPELVQGNIEKDDFLHVWVNKFQSFRTDRTSDCLKCIECPERFICGGDSAHTWDYKEKKPLLCYQDYCSYLNYDDLKEIR